jgi:putative oxidoreductase
MHSSALDFIGKQLASINLPQEFAYGVYLGEVIAPLMIILGFYTRLGGLLIFGNMIFAIVLAHRNQLFDLTDNGGLALELQIIFLLSGLAVFFLGSGKIAIKAD